MKARPMLRRYLMIFCCTLALPALPAAAQDRQETLADIRQQLSTLYVDIQNLKRELSTTGASGAATAGTVPLDRVNAIESELRRLTNKTEEMEHRINAIVSDGTNRIGDLEFRLVELEGGDVSKLGQTTTLGGDSTAVSKDDGSRDGTSQILPPVAADTSNEAQLAVGEQSDFEAAQKRLVDGDYAGAAQAFVQFLSDYPGSPLAPAAQLGRARALEEQGDAKQAARAYLDGFTLAPQAQTAGPALLGLGRLLGQLGQKNEACVTLGEVSKRFPNSSSATEAQTEMRTQGCS